ncbi:MAG TPA: TonB-dependent receptor [Flavitalea sp.]|nr:TonB-dependent receptor [Flavitalea sp.]
MKLIAFTCGFIRSCRRINHVNLSVSIFFCFLFSETALQAQQTRITGRVSDQAGVPVGDASISVKGGGGAVTDSSGRYALTLAQTGEGLLVVSHVGYRSAERLVTFSGGTITVDFVLEETQAGLNAVIFTANTSRRRQQEIPISISRFNSQQLQLLKFNSQADILRTIPGITAEGGGGEVANNVFVRGLPSGGQFVFSPIQIDGMPVISTMGLNSSAPDVYFRNDLGIASLEFVRGGSSTLYGVGSVAGIINYTSKIGTDVQRSIVEAEYATPGKVKLDFNTGGPLSENGVYYNVSGTYRYDEGPLVTGIPSNGFQVRANIRKVTDHGSFTVYGQFINDKVQFFVPYPLTTDREQPKGYDGETVTILETADAANLSALTPNGYYQSRAANGVYTKGGYLMAALEHNFQNDWKFNARLRVANYEHEFNFFNTDGNGKNPLSQSAYVTSVFKGKGTGYAYTYANDGVTLDPNALVLENTIIDRNRPLNELATNLNLSKSFETGTAKHYVTIGGFVSRTEARDFNVQMRYLSEFKDQPRILNLTYVDSLNATKTATRNGVLALPGYTNRFSSSNKAAIYLTDEISLNRFHIDFGVRVENQTGRVEAEKSATAVNSQGVSVAWGTGSFNRFNLQASDWAIAAGVSYKVTNPLNVYANFSRGYFFPNYNGFNVTVVGGIPAYPTERPEHIIQTEVGAKFGNEKITATLAAFYVKLNDRFNVSFLNVGGVLTESVAIISSESLGLEATWNWTIVKNLRLEGSLTYQTHEYTEYSATPTNVGKWLERQPQVIVNGGLLYNNRKFDAAFSINSTGKRYGNASNLVELDPYSISRLDAGYTFNMDNNSTIRLGAGVYNLFDVVGVTEGNPRAGDAQTNTGTFFVGRPILLRSYFVRAALVF